MNKAIVTFTDPEYNLTHTMTLNFNDNVLDFDVKTDLGTATNDTPSLANILINMFIERLQQTGDESSKEVNYPVEAEVVE